MMVVPRSGRTASRSVRLAGGLLVVAMLASCGSDGDSDKADKSTNTRSQEGESGLAEAGKPVRGGRLVYGLEAESANGWCLPESQLAISGNLVRRAIYDSLVIVNDEAKAVPHLAKSIEPNDDFTVWTIGLREGVTFHDGTTLDATVVKNNLDAYRGTYPARKPRLTLFTLKNFDTVTVIDDLTIEVKTFTPWVNMPYSLQIIGIMGQAQLDDPVTCNSKLIGTGPFKLDSWIPNQQFLAQRNPEYWHIAPDGEPYPYVDAIEFRPITEISQRINNLEAGEIDAMMTAQAAEIAGPLTDLRNDGLINLLVTEDHAEVNYLMLNSSKPPFDDPNMRKAMAMGIDRKAVNDLVNDGFSTIANQPFPPGDPGYVDDPGFPDYDQEAAAKLVADYVAGGGEATFTLTSQSDPTSLSRAQLLQPQLKEIGIDLKVATVDQSLLVSEAIAGNFQMMSFRQHPGGDPDFQYIWWYGIDNPINFARITDPLIDKALDDGRVEPDEAKRSEIYEQISRQFGSEVWNIWLNYTPWAVGLGADVHGVMAIELPDDGGKPFTGLADGHPLIGLWKDAG